ncbi:rubrerythrin [Anaerolentibacter hominis]|uniref:rubrerythrin n=1 Tax=Anaerolentibacter hominis TaxID=3079009 RepID=UPI0031B81A55
MAVEFKHSETKKNLMRAFAGESQARNRYTIAASQAKKEHLHVLEAIFTFTANQEKEHAEIFYDLLRDEAGDTIHIDGGYPVDLFEDMTKVLEAAAHNEYEEHGDVYPSFAQTARDEGLAKVAVTFDMIAAIEKTHGDRFKKFAEYLKDNKLFVSDVQTGWMCLNCGYIYTGKEVPEKCPVCQHDKGYFIRLELAPYSN